MSYTSSIWRIFISLSLLGLVLVSGGWIYSVMTNPTVLPIQHVRVVGNFVHLDQATLTNTVAPLVSGGFFNTHVNTIHQALLNMPWVEHVSVRRIWPDELVVQVQEQQAYVKWNDTALLNTSGQLFYPDPSTFPAHLPALFGEEHQIADMSAALEKMNVQLKPLSVTIQSLTLSPRGSWKITLNNGVSVYLGRDAVEERVNRFVRLYPFVQQYERQQISYVDLRYTNGLAVGTQNSVKVALSD